VILTVLPQFQSNLAALGRLYVRASSGQLIPLATVAKFSLGVGPLQVNHVSQFTSATISFNLKTGVALSEATAKIEQLTQKLVPSTITASFQGSAQAFQDSTSNLGLLLAVAIFVIYIVLGILYESFIHPLTILSGQIGRAHV